MKLSIKYFGNSHLFGSRLNRLVVLAQACPTMAYAGNFLARHYPKWDLKLSDDEKAVSFISPKTNKISIVVSELKD